MLVKFIPTNQVMDTDKATFTAGPLYAARTLPVNTADADGIGYIGTRVSGSPLAYTGLAAQSYLTWITQDGTRTHWQMSSPTAVTDAITNLLAAYSNAPAADVSVTLSVLGAVVAV